MADCCNLVGNLDLGLNGCIISVSTSCSTEIVLACAEDEPLEGPTIGNINITAYADSVLWRGCPGKAGVSIPYVRKYDCENDLLYFIWSGQGQSFMTSEASRYVSLVKTLGTTCTSYSASSTGGPTSLYMLSTQINGYGLSFNGNPISFTTSPNGTSMSLGSLAGGNTCYLQSFSFDGQPGQLPTVSYSFVYSPNAAEV